MKRYDYHQPQSLKEAYQFMEKGSAGNARYIAGGTDILWRIRQKAVEPDALISLRGVEGLRGIHQNGGLSLGGMTLFRDVERHSGVVLDYAALAQAAAVLANPQIRNVATLGGNLCNAAPSADSAPPLLVMEAVVVLEGPAGRREVALEHFFKGPGQTVLDRTEVLTRIRIPERQPRTGSAFLKAGRLKQDIAVVNAAALVVMKGNQCAKCRLAIGAVAPVPLRLKSVEKLVEGQEISPGLLERACELAEKEVSPISDVRSTEEYRRTMAGVLAKEVIQKAVRDAR
jgi:carbon-monoxide dehydrogenase medium subunit